MFQVLIVHFSCQALLRPTAVPRKPDAEHNVSQTSLCGSQNLQYLLKLFAQFCTAAQHFSHLGHFNSGKMHIS